MPKQKKTIQDPLLPTYVIDYRPEQSFHKSALKALRDKSLLLKIMQFMPNENLEQPNVKVGIQRDPSLPNYSELARSVHKNKPSSLSGDSVGGTGGIISSDSSQEVKIISEAYDRLQLFSKKQESYLESLQKDFAAFKTEISTIKETHNKEISTMKEEISTMKARIDKVESSILSIESCNYLKGLLLEFAKTLGGIEEDWLVKIELYCREQCDIDDLDKRNAIRNILAEWKAEKENRKKNCNSENDIKFNNNQSVKMIADLVNYPPNKAHSLLNLLQDV